MSKYPLITSIFMNLTNDCNCCCPYCFVEQHPDYMPYKVAKDITDFLINNAKTAQRIPSINFFGGEPLLCWDSVIVPLVKYIKEEYAKPFQLSMTSNCVLMDEKKLSFMKENGIDLLFSIDGDKETQDLNRPLKSGKSSFDALKDKIPLILQNYPKMTFRATLVPTTCHHLFDNIMFAQKQGYSSYFTVPNVFEEWSEENRAVTKAELRRYSEYFISSYREHKTPIMLNPYRDYIPKIQRINTAIVNDECRREDLYGACAKCGLGAKSYAAIDYKGNIYGCQELVSSRGEDDLFYIGNIYTGVDDARRERLSTSYHACVEHGENCKDCRLCRICDGGCVANNYMATGDVNRMSEVHCWWEQTILDEVIFISNTLGEEKNQEFIKLWNMTVDGGCYG